MHVPGETLPTVRHLPPADEPAQPESTLETELKNLRNTRKLSGKHADLCKEMAEKGLVTLAELKPLKMKLAADAKAEVEQWATERLKTA